jgi:predicted PhzF superfamily epimerase YddE/YHI9
VRYHIVDTFADERFAGNPAAVVHASAFPSVEVMRQSAYRIGLPTTAYVVPHGPGAYRVRWFTPYAEINLCGHATIASACHLFGLAHNTGRAQLRFESDNGILYTERVGDLIGIDLPAAGLTRAVPPPGLLDALRTEASTCAVSSDDILIEVESPQAVAELRPDFAALARLPFRGHIVTARGVGEVDFVSRTFFPSLGVNEDQVCVTAHCKLATFWAARLGRPMLAALQLSERGGRLVVEDRGTRVRVLGSAVPRGHAGELTPEALISTAKG